MLGRSVMVEPAEYEQLDKADQWMCYPTLPAVDLLKFWQARWEKLVWIPVYNPKGSLATASWWRRAIPCSDEEEYILNSDTEYDPMDDGSDVESGSSDSGAESEGGEDNTSAHVDEGTSKKVLSDKEVTELLADAFGEGGQKFRISTPPEDWKEEGGEDWEEGEEGEDEDWEEEGGEDWEEGGGEAKGNEERTDKPILASGVKSDAQAFAKPNQEEEAQVSNIEVPTGGCDCDTNLSTSFRHFTQSSSATAGQIILIARNAEPSLISSSRVGSVHSTQFQTG